MDLFALYQLTAGPWHETGQLEFHKRTISEGAGRDCGGPRGASKLGAGAAPRLWKDWGVERPPCLEPSSGHQPFQVAIGNGRVLRGVFQPPCDCVGPGTLPYQEIQSLSACPPVWEYLSLFHTMSVLFCLKYVCRMAPVVSVLCVEGTGSFCCRHKMGVCRPTAQPWLR